MVESAEANRDETGIAEAAAILHDRDLIHIVFVGTVLQAALHRLLHVVTLDAAERRQRGGPAKIWAVEGDPSIVLDQIDYEQLLARACGRARRGRSGRPLALHRDVDQLRTDGIRRALPAPAARHRVERDRDRRARIGRLPPRRST
jgi:hypothetical protein